MTIEELFDEYKQFARETEPNLSHNPTTTMKYLFLAALIFFLSEIIDYAQSKGKTL